MALTMSQVFVGGARIWVAPADTAQVADTVLEGAEYPGPWVALGATEAGVALVYNPGTQNITVDESPYPIDITKTETDLQFQFALAQDSPENVKYAMGGGSLVVAAAGAPASGLPPKKTVTLQDGLEMVALSFDAIDPAASIFRRLWVPRAKQVGTVNTGYRRAANNRSYSVAFRALHAAVPFELRVATGARP